MTDHNLDDLDPVLKPLTLQWLAKCQLYGLDVKITETWRDPAREDALHAQGITRATSATCDHCDMVDGKPASRAFDFACFRNHIYIQNGEDVAYALAGKLAKDLGLTWGGNFVHAPPDWDHIQLS